MGSERGDAGSQGVARDAADSAALSRLLRQADESIVVPEDLWERITEPMPVPEAQSGAVAASAKRSAGEHPVSRLRVGSGFISGGRWLYPALGALVVVTLAIGAFWAGVSWQQHRRVESPVDVGSSITLTVYNSEKACQDLRTIECSLSIAANPRAPYSGANIVGRVWHGEKVVADCVITNGPYLADESGVSSRRWYHVTLPDGTVGWLPGARTRNTQNVALCH